VIRTAVVLAAFAAAALLATAGAAAPVQVTTLFGVVGPEFTIALADAQGNRVTRIDAGRYEIEIDDRSDFHTFHLTGPGVDQRTEVAFTGKVRWNVTLTDGVYRYVCDVHPSGMSGTFTAGTPPTDDPPPTPPPGGGGITAKTKLVLTSGPAYAITLKTAAGKAVRSMRTGTYTVTVRDRSAIHNAHLIAPGYNRATRPPAYRGTQTWKVKLANAGTLRFLCDPHSRRMKGSARIVR
jgi:plastocyanin